MKLIKEFTRQCCNALRGVSCWSGAISEVVEVVACKVCTSVCGQDRTISQEKYCVVLVVLPGRKLAAVLGPKMCMGCAYSRLYTEPEVMWYQSCEGFLVITSLLSALVFSGKFTQKVFK